MQPSRARYRVLAFTTILAIITYLDRVAISSAAPAVRSEMGLECGANGVGVQRLHVGVRGV